MKLTDQEKLDQGFFTSQLDVNTNIVTQVPFTDEQVEQGLNPVIKTSQPTVSELQAKLAEISAQLQALQGSK